MTFFKFPGQRSLHKFLHDENTPRTPRGVVWSWRHQHTWWNSYHTHLYCSNFRNKSILKNYQTGKHTQLVAATRERCRGMTTHVHVPRHAPSHTSFPMFLTHSTTTTGFTTGSWGIDFWILRKILVKWASWSVLRGIIDRSQPLICGHHHHTCDFRYFWRDLYLPQGSERTHKVSISELSVKFWPGGYLEMPSKTHGSVTVDIWSLGH